MATWTPGWQAFYDSAQQQSQIDPALVTAIAISESGWSANGGASGPVNLGIDSSGTPGLPGTPSGVGNATHRFYTYSSGAEAAQGLAAYLSTPLYRGTGILGLDPASMLDRMVGHGYSGCPGPECDAQWGQKILNIRQQVIGQGGGYPFNPDPNAVGAPPIGSIPMPGGPTPPGTPRTPAEANPCAAAGQGVPFGLGPVVVTFCEIGRVFQPLTQRGFWWSVLFFGAGLAAVVAGAMIYFKGDLSMGRLAA